MKYCVNHPHNFKHANLRVSTLIAPFMLGFFQCTIGMFVEILVMIYLLSLNNILDIISKYVALACVTNFDNMYANALYEEQLLATIGKRIPKEFSRNNDPIDQTMPDFD